MYYLNLVTLEYIQFFKHLGHNYQIYNKNTYKIVRQVPTIVIQCNFFRSIFVKKLDLRILLILNKERRVKEVELDVKGD